MTKPKRSDIPLKISKTTQVHDFTRIFAELAHELAQPLTAINNYMAGCVKRLQSGAVSTNVLLDALQESIQQLERAEQIIYRMKNVVQYDKVSREKVKKSAAKC
jgi:hypothetical protein